MDVPAHVSLDDLANAIAAWDAEGSGAQPIESAEIPPRLVARTASQVVSAVAGEGFFPAAPQSLAESGLTSSFVQEHLLRLVYFADQATGAELADECGVPYASVIGPELEHLRRDHLVEVRTQRVVGEAGFVFGLTARGTTRALGALQKTQYRGPLPVPFQDYVASVEAQTSGEHAVTEGSICEAFSDLILDHDMLEQIGPAVNSGSAMFLFGPPGNGKTSVAERITNLLGGPMYVPHALEMDGYVVKLFDLLVHRPAGEVSTLQDERWIRVRRPTVIAGGELSLASLDMLWNDISRFYEAPLQLKANGGMFLIDDFGRQTAPPRDLLNRWIVPLEKHVDFLTLLTGKKIRVPFEELIVFSTNLDPKDLLDEAFLRRIQFKINVKDPTPEHFTEIMRVACHNKQVDFDEAGLEYMLRTWWSAYARPLRMCQPRDILDQMVAIAKYKQTLPTLANTDLIDRACASYFVTE